MDHSDLSGLFILVLVTRPGSLGITQINSGLLTLFRIIHINFNIIILGSFILFQDHYFWIIHIISGSLGYSYYFSTIISESVMLLQITPIISGSLGVSYYSDYFWSFKPCIMHLGKPKHFFCFACFLELFLRTLCASTTFSIASCVSLSRIFYVLSRVSPRQSFSIASHVSLS